MESRKDRTLALEGQTFSLKPSGTLSLLYHHMDGEVDRVMPPEGCPRLHPWNLWNLSTPVTKGTRQLR